MDKGVVCYKCKKPGHLSKACGVKLLPSYRYLSRSVCAESAFDSGCGFWTVSFRCLFGRDWLTHIRIDWKQINRLSNDSPLQKVLEKYTAVFQEGLGTLCGFKAKIHVNENAQPKYCRARSIPYTFREKVEQELQRLQKEGTIEPVKVSDWAAPIVPVIKRDKSVRICGDFRLTVNSVSKLDNYPIPKVEDLFAKLGDDKLFTKLVSKFDSTTNQSSML